MGEPIVVKQGIYTISQLNLSPDADYVVQNNSFSERALVIIYDSKPNSIQFVRLIPQSKKYSLKPLQNDYTILVLGSESVTFYREPSI